MPGQIIRPFGPTLYRGKFSEDLRKEVIEKSTFSGEDASYNLAGNITKQLQEALLKLKYNNL